MFTEDMGRSSSSLEMPRGIITQARRFTPAIESPRTELFLEGTETDEIRLVDNRTGREAHATILYPTDGTVIAMDPDIPVKHQRVQFSSRGNEEVAWLMDGVNVGNGVDVGWTPTGGRHRLQLMDLQGKQLDSVTFEVRGAL